MNTDDPNFDLEEWKIIDDYPLYLISNFGNVYSLLRNRLLKPLLDTHGYCYISLYPKHKNFLIHKLVAESFISNPNKFLCVDHLDHNRLNNFVDNLRYCSYQQNNYNTNIRKDNTSLYKGVSYNKRDKKWQAKIRIPSKQISLGYFNTALEASNAYESYAKQLHGQFYNDTRI